MVLTFTEYDNLVEQLQDISSETLILNESQIEIAEQKIINGDKLWLEFCCYLSEMRPKNLTPEEKALLGKLDKMLNRHLELIDETEIKEEN